ncbi:MAG: PhoU domain-containing protein [Rickettsiales bacterium]|nr:PhoU domain-containing protein [Rickettsiales bacterium]
MQLDKQHAHAGYDEMVQEMLGDMTSMKDIVETLLEMMVKAVDGDEVSLREAKTIDKEVNELEQKVISSLHSLLTKYSPALDELRFLMAMMQMASRLERMGDMAKANIRRLENAWPSEGKTLPGPVQKAALQMLELTREMLASAMRNVSEFDVDRLSRNLGREDEVNSLYLGVLETIEDGPMKAWKKDMSKYNALLMLLKDIERCADQSFEIGRISYFAHTGERPKKKEIRNS